MTIHSEAHIMATAKTPSKTASRSKSRTARAGQPVAPSTTALVPVEPTVPAAQQTGHHERHEHFQIAPYQPALPGPMLRAGKMHLMLSQMLTRSMCNQMASASVLPTALDGDTLSEIAQIQQAIFSRLQKQQETWVQGLQNIVQEYNQLKAANAMSKFVEQEYNVFAQFSELVNDQVTTWVGLLENIQVDYAYWISQKITGAAKA
jgi:hypothetical protein